MGKLIKNKFKVYFSTLLAIFFGPGKVFAQENPNSDQDQESDDNDSLVIPALEEGVSTSGGAAGGAASGAAAGTLSAGAIAAAVAAAAAIAAAADSGSGGGAGVIPNPTPSPILLMVSHVMLPFALSFAGVASSVSKSLGMVMVTVSFPLLPAVALISTFVSGLRMLSKGFGKVS